RRIRRRAGAALRRPRGLQHGLHPGLGRRAGADLPRRRAPQPGGERGGEPERSPARRDRSRRGLPRDDAARLRAVRPGWRGERAGATARRHPAHRASVSGGSFDTRKVDLARAATVGPWEYLAFAHYLGSAGDFRFINDLGTTANPADDREETRLNNAFNLGNLTARLGYHGLGPATLALVTDTFAKDEGVPGVGSVQATDTSFRILRQVAHLDLTVPPPPTLPVSLEASSYLLYQDQRFRDPK